jgi:hypothetical protein
MKSIRIEYSARESIYVFRAEWIENGVVVDYGNWKDGKSTYPETREIAIKHFGNLTVTTSH